MSRTEVEDSTRLAKGLTEALGLDSDLVRSIDIHCFMGNVPTITVTRFVSSEEITEILELGLTVMDAEDSDD